MFWIELRVQSSAVNQDIQAAMDYISNNFLSCYGRPYKFVRITNAPTINLISLNLTALTSDLSYVNSLILNKTVIIPSFDSFELDLISFHRVNFLFSGYTADERSRSARGTILFIFF